VVTKLDRLARSFPDARAIADELTAREVTLALGTSVHDPTDPVGRLLFNVLAMVAEFEAGLIRARTRDGMKVARAKGRLRGKRPKLSPMQEAHLVGLCRAGEHTVSELGELFGVTQLPHHSRDRLFRRSVYPHVASPRERPRTRRLDHQPQPRHQPGGARRDLARSPQRRRASSLNPDERSPTSQAARVTCGHGHAQPADNARVVEGVETDGFGSGAT
jgi:hypothetical protein